MSTVSRALSYPKRSTQYAARSTFLLLLLLLAACQPAAPVPDLPVSAWGSVITVAQAEQPNAPALAVSESGVMAAWVGADEQGVFQSLRTLNNDAMGEPVRLPLGVRPYAQRFAPAGNGRQHLFWLDSNVEGETRLFTALLKPDLQRERELTILTRDITRRFTLLPAAEGGVWAIAAGGLASEPALTAYFVDGDGRWRLNENDRIATDADWPAVLQRADGLVSLYWLRDTDNTVMRGLFAEGLLLNPQPVVEGVTLNAGDRLESFTAAQDNAYAYLFWNITRADGSRETWYTAAPPDAPTWERPTRLGVDVADDIGAASTFDSGFNVGVVFAASSGADAVSWVVPAAGRFPVLPVAALVGGELSVVFMRDGQIVGYRPMGIRTNLVGLPALAVDRDLYLYLAWAQPDPAGYASLQLASMKVGAWSWVKTAP